MRRVKALVFATLNALWVSLYGKRTTLVAREQTTEQPLAGRNYFDTVEIATGSKETSP